MAFGRLRRARRNGLVNSGIIVGLFPLLGILVPKLRVLSDLGAIGGRGQAQAQAVHSLGIHLLVAKPLGDPPRLDAGLCSLEEPSRCRVKLLPHVVLLLLLVLL